MCYKTFYKHNRRWVLAISYTLAVFIFQESVFRFIFPLPDVDGFNRIHYMPVNPGSWHVTAIRNMKLIGQSSPDHVKVIQTLNEYGFRGQRWRTQKQHGTKRVFFVGDSFVFGDLVPDDETIPEGFRARALDASVTIDAMNLGIDGANMISYTELILDAVPLFEPDAVLVIMYANDLPTTTQEAQPRTFQRFKHTMPRLVQLLLMLKKHEMLPCRWGFKQVSFNQPVPSPNNPWSNEEFEAAHREDLTPRMLAAMKNGTFNPWRTSGSEYIEWALKAPFDVRDHLSFLQAYVEAHGARLLVAYIPERGMVTNYYQTFEHEYSLTLPVRTDMTQPAYQMHRQMLSAQ